MTTQYQFVVSMQEALEKADQKAFLDNLHAYIVTYYNVAKVADLIRTEKDHLTKALDGELPFTMDFLHNLLKEVNLNLKITADYTSRILALINKDR